MDQALMTSWIPIYLSLDVDRAGCHERYSRWHLLFNESNHDRAMQGKDGSDDVSICDMKKGKVTCNDLPLNLDGDKIPTLPRKIGWVIVAVGFLLLAIGLLLNHLTMSIDTPTFVFPFFGGIDIDRWTLYDISLFLMVGAFFSILIVVIFAVKSKSKVIVINKSSLD